MSFSARHSPVFGKIHMEEMKNPLVLLLCVLLGLSSAAESAVIRHAADLAAALRDGGSPGRTFDLTATVTYVSTNRADEKTNVAVEDPSGCVLFRAENRRGLSALPRRGAVARCRGNLEQNVYGRTFAVLTGYEETGSTDVPTPADLSRSELFDGKHDFMYCRFSGTLRDVAFNETDPHWLMLAVCNREGRVFATVPISSAGDFHRLSKTIGSGISITGICVPYDHSPRLQTGRMFKIAAMDSIRILPQANDDALTVPSVESIRTAQPSDVATLGRHRAVGHVVASWQSNRALLRTDTGDFIGLEFSQRNRLPKYGERGEATGLPESDLFRINLINATWRPLPNAALPPERPAKVSPRTMTVDEDGNRRVNCVYHGHAITISGIVRSLANDSSDRRLYVESDSCVVPVNADSGLEAFRDLAVGCEVEVSGTCVIEVAAPRLNSAIPRILGFAIVVRTPEDIRILSSPSWWTPGRLMVLIGSLFASLLAILVWNTALRRLAEKRGRELSEETIARVTADLKVYERTRLAVELHDTLAQNLTGVSMEIDTAEMLSREQPGTIREHLVTASRALKSCRNELRNCLWDMRNEALEANSMDDAIRQTLAPHVAGVDLAVRFSVPRDRISDTTAHAILRIVRELTLNAIRHGKATAVKVAGSIEGTKLLFSVRDNGSGFDPDNCPGDEQGHYGLLGIRERVNSFEGTMKIDSAPGKGSKTTISINIPHESES